MLSSPFTRKTLTSRCHPFNCFRRSVNTDGSTSETSVLQSEFRVLLPPQKQRVQERKNKRHRDNAAPRYKSMPIDQDWTKVWPTRAMFKASVVPLPLRQGMVTCMLENDGIPPAKYGNTELMKIPNFLHLTPRHIAQHCEAIKVLCTKFPEVLKDPEVVREHLPVEITTRDYLESSCNIRDERARVVQIQVPLSSLMLDEVSADKFRRLAGKERVCPKSDLVTIVADRCPWRAQNLDYAHYLLAATYLESQVREKWEAEKHHTDWERYFWDKSPAKTKFESMIGKLGHHWSPQEKEELEAEYKQVVTDLHDKGHESKEDLMRYRRVVERLYQIKTME